MKISYLRNILFCYFIVIFYNVVKLLAVENSFYSLKKKTKEYNNTKNKFKQLYDESRTRLYSNVLLAQQCIKIKKSNECNYKADDIITVLPNESTKPTEIYNTYSGGFASLVEPKYDCDDIEIIVGIPCGPSQIIGRIAIRDTYMKEIIIDGYNAKYIFLTGLAPEPYYYYPLDYLKEESEMFNDMLVFDVINTYHNITLLMMSTYLWLLENYPKLKYFIRSNLDVIFFPKRANGLLKDKGHDIIAEIVRYRRKNIYYPQGSFYVFSMKIIGYIYNHSFIHKPIHRWDDVYYGEIIASAKNKFNIYDMGGENKLMRWDCNICNSIYINKYIALHPFSPSSIILFYILQQ